MDFKFSTKNTDEGIRLDVFLAANISSTSRSGVAKYIKNGYVSVNGEKADKPSIKLKPESKIKINIPYTNEEYSLKPQKMEINVVYEDKNLIVVNKNPGVSVHPGAGNWNNTLMNGLLYKYKNLKHIGKPYRYSLINRVDKETSGIVLVAKNNESLWFYSRQFEERKVEKYYLALVGGDISKMFKEKSKLIISNYLGRKKGNRRIFSVVDKKYGRLSTTLIYFLAKTKISGIGNVSSIMACPKTGRTHQIRVHLKSAGYPIIGDELYSKIKFKRMMLHSYAVRLEMMSGKRKIYVTEIPEEMKKYFDSKEVNRFFNESK